MTTLVLVGNAKQSFHRFLDAVNAISSILPQPVIVQHGNTRFQDVLCQCHDFLDRDTFTEMMSTTELIICHAGAGTVIEALRAGLTPVVMPRRRAFGEHIDDHQIEFASALQDAGKAIVVNEPTELKAAIAQALALGRRTRAGVADFPLISMVRDALRLAAAASGARQR